MFGLALRTNAPCMSHLASRASAYSLMMNQLANANRVELFDGIDSTAKLLDLARSFGRPRESPSGELIKELRITSSDRAKKGTLSGCFGETMFPLHTDTAFWRIPAKYLVMRVRGDMRRQTIFLPFENRIGHSEAEISKWIMTSLWYRRTSGTQVCCHMKFRIRNQVGYRFDMQTMVPVNSSALSFVKYIERICMGSEIQAINWSPGMAAVIPNWHVLHGRGSGPADESERIMERIYVS
jgi:hypothetical protein